MRYGLEDRLIDFGKKALVPARELMTGGMEKDLENAAELDSLQDVVYMQTILEKGTSADRQLAVYRQARDEGADGKEALQTVVDHICRETVLGVP
jgi:carboxylate-amine ligase